MLLLHLCFSLLAALATDQQPDLTEPPVHVIHFFNEKTLTYDIYCANDAPDNYSIELDFEVLEGLRPSTPYPLRKTIEPGTHLLMRLTQKELDSRGNFKISLTYRRGNLVYSIPENFPYLLPLKKGTVANFMCPDSLRSFYPAAQKDSSFQIYGFYLQQSDTIYASRRGIVSKFRDQLVDTALTEKGLGYFLDIQHVDGSYGRYDGIQAVTPIVKIGQTVEAGDPIAVVEKNNSEISFFSFQVFYYAEKVVTDKIGPSNTKTITIPLRFEGVDSMSHKYCYMVNHPTDIICMEMSKKDLRKWTRKKDGWKFPKMLQGRLDSLGNNKD